LLTDALAPSVSDENFEKRVMELSKCANDVAGAPASPNPLARSQNSRRDVEEDHRPREPHSVENASNKSTEVDIAREIAQLQKEIEVQIEVSHEPFVFPRIPSELTLDL
jgi:hypothetical protein